MNFLQSGKTGEDDRKQLRLQGGVATDSILLFFVKCLVAVVRIAQIMILSRALTKDAYGTYSQALLVITLFAPLFSLGLDSALNYFFNKSKSEQERMRWTDTIFGLSFAAGGIGAVLLFVFRDQVGAYYHNAAIVPLMIYIALRPCLQNIVANYQNLYVSSGFAKAIAVRNLVVSLAQIAAVGAAVVVTNDLVLLFLLLLLLDVAQIVVFSRYYGAKRFKLHPWRIARACIVPILAFSVPMLLANSVGIISGNLSRLLVGNMMSIEDFALYSLMSTELPFSFVVASFTTVVTPKIVGLLANRKMDVFRRLWGDYIEFGYTVTWPLCVAALVVAPQMIEVLYSTDYLTPQGIAVFRICLVASMLRFTYFGLVPTALGESRIVLLYTFIAMAINVPLTFVLFAAGGMVGASFASAIAMLGSGCLYFARSARLTQTSLAEAFRTRKLVSLVIEMALLAIGTDLLVKALAPLHMGALLECALAFLVMVGGIALFKGRDIKRILQSMNKA